MVTRELSTLRDSRSPASSQRGCRAKELGGLVAYRVGIHVAHDHQKAGHDLMSDLKLLSGVPVLRVVVAAGLDRKTLNAWRRIDPVL